MHRIVELEGIVYAKNALLMRLEMSGKENHGSVTVQNVCIVSDCNMYLHL